MGRGSGSWGCPLAPVIHPVGGFPWRQEEVPLLVLIHRTHFWLAWWIPVHNSPKAMSVPGLQMRKQSHQHHPARQQLKGSLAFCAATLSSPQSLPACCCSTFSLWANQKNTNVNVGESVYSKSNPPPRHRDVMHTHGASNSAHDPCTYGRASRAAPRFQTRPSPAGVGPQG